MLDLFNSTWDSNFTQDFLIVLVDGFNDPFVGDVILENSWMRNSSSFNATLLAWIGFLVKEYLLDNGVFECEWFEICVSKSVLWY